MPLPPSASPLLQRHALPWLALLLCAGLFRWLAGDGDAGIGGLLLPAVAHAVLYGLLYRLVTGCHPLGVSLAYLAVPYVLFAFGWLHWPYALVLLAALGWACWRTWRQQAPAALPALPADGPAAWPGYLLVLAWVSLCGVGGYGFQTADHMMHNGRLHDLASMDWPVRYADGQYLVGYLGYYLPAALAGKYGSWQAATVTVHAWTLLGCWLVLRWLQLLLAERQLLWLALAFVLFGGWDIAGYALSSWQRPWQDAWLRSDRLDFWTSNVMGEFFLGNFVSNGFSLFWSPHQVVAGWLVAAMMTWLFLRRASGGVIVVHGLLSLWSPMIAVALLPFSLAALWQDWRAVLCGPVIAFAACVVFFTGAFYLAGSALANPAFIIWGKIGWDIRLLVPVLMMVFSWGIYLAALRATGSLPASGPWYRWLLCLLAVLLLLPQWHYGAFSDVFCRGAAVAMLLLFLFYWRAIRQLQVARRPLAAAVLVLLLVPGSVSGAGWIGRSLADYRHRVPVLSVADYHWGHEFMGRADAFFMQYLMKR